METCIRSRTGGEDSEPSGDLPSLSEQDGHSKCIIIIDLDGEIASTTDERKTGKFEELRFRAEQGPKGCLADCRAIV
jgi:hypothetical protein